MAPKSLIFRWWVLASMMLTSVALDTSCMITLLPCLDYVSKSTLPPKTCCAALRTVLRTDFQCICHVITDSSLINSTEVNASAASTLPSHCGLEVNVQACQGYPNNGSDGTISLSWLVMTIMMMLLMMI